MKPREKTLLIIFLTLLASLAGGGLLVFSLKSYRSIAEDNQALAVRLAAMKETVAQGEQWQARSQWLESHVPFYASREEASTKLLDLIQQEAQKAGLTLGGRELIDGKKNPDEEGVPRSFEHAEIKLTLSSVPEETFFKWLHALTRPENLLGVTRLQLEPSADSKTINCEIQITHYHRLDQEAPKITKAS